LPRISRQACLPRKRRSDGANELSAFPGNSRKACFPRKRRSDEVNELFRLRGSERYEVSDDAAAAGKGVFIFSSGRENEPKETA